MGLFDNIVQYQGELKNVETAMQSTSQDPYVQAAKQAINMLPEGDLKKLMQDPNKDIISVIKNSLKFFKLLIFGRKYTSTEYQIGERYFDQIAPNDNPDMIKSWRDVPDDVVPVAQQLMAILFGVRINKMEDLYNLQDGVNAYYSRDERDDIPRNAVERAVYLKQNFFPDSMYNKQKWDISIFEKYPLVAPIPSIVYGELYTGELPGGAMAENGVIVGDSAIDQLLGEKSFDPNVQVPDDSAVLPAGGGNNTMLLIGAAVLAAYLLFKRK